MGPTWPGLATAGAAGASDPGKGSPRHGSAPARVGSGYGCGHERAARPRQLAATQWLRRIRCVLSLSLAPPRLAYSVFLAGGAHTGGSGGSGASMAGSVPPPVGSVQSTR
jgi:hypothetical protein